MIKKTVLTTGMVISLFLMFTALPVVADVKVYDANNKYLGILLYPGYEDSIWTHIYIPPFGTARITIDKNGNGILVEYSAINVYYESADCSGTPYTILTPGISGPGPGYFPSIQKVGGKYFVTDTKSPKKVFAYKSSLGSASCTAANGTTNTLIPLLEIPSASLPFPFTYPVHFEYVPGDISGNGKIGLEDAIPILQIVSGFRTQ